MARWPDAAWRPLPENATEGPNDPRLLIFHTMQGWQHGTEQWFRRADIRSESHFGVAMDPTTDAPVRQWIDTDREADTNWDANGISVTVELEDRGDPSNPLTYFQLQTCIDLGVWACRTHGIPSTIASVPDGAGLGWHQLFTEWNRNGHHCPGPIRITQLRDIVFPEIARRLGEEIEEMVTHPDDVRYFQRILARRWDPPHDHAGPPYDIGAIDGIIGPKTEAAISDWQTRRHIQVTGTLNETTVATLQSHANRAYATEQAKAH